MFIGHPEEGQRSAVIYSVLGSCRRLGINPAEYLQDLFERLPKAKTPEIKSLTPAAWLKTKRAPARQSAYERLKQIKEKAAELKVLGRDIYQFDRSMEVLKTAAANEGASAGLMQAGVGLAVGTGLGQQMMQQSGQLMTKLPPGAPPTLPAPFHVAVDGKDAGAQDIEAIKKLVESGNINRSTLVWREGMTNWQSAGEVPELKMLFRSPPPLPARRRD